MEEQALNGIMDAKGVLHLTTQGQYIQITNKHIEIWERTQKGLHFFIKRYKKDNRWVTKDGGKNMFML